MRRLALISDLHFGAAAPDCLRALEAALGAAAPDLTVIAGDFTQRGSWDEFREAETFLRRLRGPLLAVPGNHDIPRANPFARFVRPFCRYRRTIGRVSRDRFADNEIAVLGLNSARPWGPHWNWAHGRVSPRAIADARAWFQTRSPGAFGALVVHHPPVLFEPRHGFRRLGRGAAMLSMMAESGIGAVLSGHLHRTGWRLIDGVLHVHSGTSASSRVRGERNSFLLIDVAESGLEIVEWLVGEDGSFAVARREAAPRSAG
ncbi:MAG: metallophosphoesterase [Phycisphaerales bacterium]|nr:metallophosphoesterase [Phycisphaerales bacterium]